MINSIVVPVGGLGSRNLPATKSIPKELLPIVDKPALQYIVEEAVAAGISDVLFVTSRYKKAIEDYFDDFPDLEEILLKKGKADMLRKVKEPAELARFFFTRQKHANGLGDAVSYAEEHISDDAFAIALPDDIVRANSPCLKQMVEVYEKYRCSVIAVEKVAWEDVSKYGIISGKEIEPGLFELYNVIEKPARDKAPTNYAIIGRYILTKQIFSELKTIKRGAGGEYQLTDAILSLIKKEKVYGYIFEGERFDIGNPAGFIKTNINFGLNNPEYSAELKDYLKSL